MSVLDAFGHELQSIRTATNGPPIILSQSQYDLAGRLVAQTNALLGVTTISETANTNGALIRTTVNPDGGTRAETNYLDGSLKQIGGTAVHPVQYFYGVDSDGPFTMEAKVAPDGSTNEWVKTSSDALGRSWKTLYPDGYFSYSTYNSSNQLASETDPDNDSTLYAYNGKGEQVYSATDMDQDGAINFIGTDRITFTTNDVIYDQGVNSNVRRTRTYVWSTLNGFVNTFV